MDTPTRALIYLVPTAILIFGLNGLVSYFTAFDLPSIGGLKLSIFLIFLGLILAFIMGKIERKKREEI